MLKAYLNQEAEYRLKTGTDSRGQPVYADAETIPCRRQAKIQNVYTRDSQTVQTQHIYYTTSPVHEGDQLDGKTVTAVSEWTGLGGETVGYKAAM